MDTNEVQIQLTQAQQIQRTMTMVENMHERLFANGTGVIKEMQEDIDSLNETRSKMRGAFTVMTAFMGFVGWPHIRALFKP